MLPLRVVTVTRCHCYDTLLSSVTLPAEDKTTGPLPQSVRTAPFCSVMLALLALGVPIAAGSESSGSPSRWAPCALARPRSAPRHWWPWPVVSADAFSRQKVRGQEPGHAHATCPDRLWGMMVMVAVHGPPVVYRRISEACSRAVDRLQASEEWLHMGAIHETRKVVLILMVFAVSLLGCTLLSSAQDLMPGRDYVLIQPAQPTENPGRIEVIEFFSYGSPRSNELYPPLEKWAAGLPRDVVFRRVPVSFNRDAWAQLGRLYLTLQAMGLSRLDSAVFKAVHVERVSLHNEQEMARWVAGHGVDAATFLRTYHSFGIQARAAKSEQMAAAYRVQSVPCLAVNGRYMVVPSGGDPTELIRHADGLIQKVRDEQRKR